MQLWDGTEAKDLGRARSSKIQHIWKWAHYLKPFCLPVHFLMCLVSFVSEADRASLLQPRCFEEIFEAFSGLQPPNYNLLGCGFSLKKRTHSNFLLWYLNVHIHKVLCRTACGRLTELCSGHRAKLFCEIREFDKSHQLISLQKVEDRLTMNELELISSGNHIDEMEHAQSRAHMIDTSLQVQGFWQTFGKYLIWKLEQQEMVHTRF